MRSDCIGDCFIKALRKRYNFTDFPTYNKLLRWELLRANPNMTINNIRYDKGLKTRAQCTEKCRPDYKYKYYLLERIERPRVADWEKSLIITLTHSRVPDVSITHSPQISFISFICNFGGLLGMWLGLSILSIFDASIALVKKFCCQGNFYLANNIAIFNSNIFKCKRKNKRNQTMHMLMQAMHNVNSGFNTNLFLNVEDF